MNEYIIPHNFKNNGRIFNMFTKKGAYKASFCIASLMIILKVIPVALFTKATIFIGIGFPICLFTLMEYDTFFINVIRFFRNRKVYYRYFDKKGEENVKITSFYEEEKRRKAKKSKR